MIALPAALALSTLVPFTVQQDSTKLDTIRMAEVVVTATRSGETVRKEQPVALSVVLPEVRDVSRGSVASDLLRDVPGVHVQQTSAGQGAVILRGLVGNQVLLLVDGIPLNNGTYRDGPGQYLATIDPESIERIEVIRGPASVLYGSDAQGGVLNVITRSHPQSGNRSIRVAAKASSANSGYRARVSGGTSGQDWSLTVGGSYANIGDLRAGGGLGPQTPTGFDTYGIDTDFRLSLGERQRVRAAVHHFKMSDVPRYDRYVTFRAPDPGPDWEHLFDPQTRQLAFVRHTLTSPSLLLTRLETTASLSVQREGRSRVRLTANGQPDQHRTLWRDDAYTPGVSVTGSSMIALGPRLVALTWGGDFYHDRIAAHGEEIDLATQQTEPLTRETVGGTIPTGRFPDGAKADRLGTFLSAEVHLGDIVRLTGGARWSRFRNEANVGTEFGGQVDNTSSELTGQLGLVVAPADEWRLALRFAEGFRAPNLYDLTNVGPAPGGVVLPNPDADPEHSLSGEIGVRYAGAGAAFDVTVFRTGITDYIDRVPGAFQGDTLYEGDRVFLGQNVGTAVVYGVEAETVVRLGSVQARGTFLYSHGDQEDAGGVETPMSKMPPLGGSASFRWTSQDRRIWVEYNLRWAAKQDRLGIRDLQDSRIPEGGTPGYAVQGVGMSAEIVPRVSLTAGIENLTDELYRDHSSGVDNAGRHVWVGISALGVL